MAASEIFYEIFTRNSNHEKYQFLKVYMNASIFWSIVIAFSSNLVDWNKHSIYFKLAKILYYICTQSSLSKL